MHEVFLLANGTVVTGGAEPGIVPGGGVVWRDERILGVGAEAALRREFPGARIVDAAGGLILPGQVNLHHHLYSSLARGLDPRAPITNFGEVLDRLWWRLDRALDPETVRLSAELALADCVRWGCTTLFDHHASPSCISGSLDLIAEAVEGAGLSAVLCYEVTDRNGHEGALAGLEENLRFLEARRAHPRVRGMIGLHASFTLRDETLAAVRERRPDGVGCHIHVAEDMLDVVASVEAFGKGPVERLETFELLDDRTLLAHGIHLEPQGYERIAERGSVLVHNPESNANNGVGRLDPVEAAGEGCLVGLGTDGMAASMLRALRAAFLLHRAETRDPGSGFEGVPELLWNNVVAARRFFDEPLLGELVPDAPADLVVLNAPPPTPLEPGNLFGHLVYGASEAPVRHTIARGRILFEDFRHVLTDPAALAARAREAAPALWDRFHALGWGTSFLGE